MSFIRTCVLSVVMGLFVVNGAFAFGFGDIVSKATDQIVDKATDKAVEKVVGTTTVKSTDQIVDEATDKATDKAVNSAFGETGTTTNSEGVDANGAKPGDSG